MQTTVRAPLPAKRGANDAICKMACFLFKAQCLKTQCYLILFDIILTLNLHLQHSFSGHLLFMLSRVESQVETRL